MMAPFPAFPVLPTRLENRRFAFPLPGFPVGNSRKPKSAILAQPLETHHEMRLSAVPASQIVFPEIIVLNQAFPLPGLLYTTYIWACSGNTRPYEMVSSFPAFPGTTFPKSHHHPTDTQSTAEACQLRAHMAASRPSQDRRASMIPNSDPLPSSPPMAMLALDLGTKTGWALRLADRTVTSGTVEFKNDRWQGGGMRFLRFKQWLTEVKQMAGGLDAVFVEEVRRHAGVDAAHAYGGFLAHVTAWCEHHAIPYEAVPVGTIKRHATGKGNANKDAMIEAARKRGFDPADDNEADALGLLDWAMANRDGGETQ